MGVENSVENVYNCVYLELLNYLCKSNTLKTGNKCGGILQVFCRMRQI